MVKVAINGFGRIGRLAFRQMFGAEGYEMKALIALRELAAKGTCCISSTAGDEQEAAQQAKAAGAKKLLIVKKQITERPL